MTPKPSMMVLKFRTELLEKAAHFYQTLGFDLQQSREINQPDHFVHHSPDFSLKLYPLARQEGYPMPQARLGFNVEEECIERMDAAGYECFKTAYGHVVRDPMGRFIELYPSEKQDETQ